MLKAKFMNKKMNSRSYPREHSKERERKQARVRGMDPEYLISLLHHFEKEKTEAMEESKQK